MEYIFVTTLLGIGYLIQRNKRQGNTDHSQGKKATHLNTAQKSLYESSYINEAKQAEIMLNGTRELQDEIQG